MENSKSKMENLPLQDLEKIGLYKAGNLGMSDKDIESLLSGRRTDMISLKWIQVEGISVENLDAKLSLYRDPTGKTSLQIHPIYHIPQKHPLLTQEETQALITQQVYIVSKQLPSTAGQFTTIHIEYDKETRDFVSYDPSLLPQIVQVNGIPLSPAQQEDFRKGKVIELHDGTKFQHSATDSLGVLSDRKRLILSVLIDGGLSYLIFRELKNLRDQRFAQSEGLTKSYNETLAQLIMQEKEYGDKQSTVMDYKDQLNNRSMDAPRYTSR